MAVAALLKGARWGGPHTDRRRLIQLSFLAVFVLLPLGDLFRFDLPAGRLHLFRQEIWLDEWAVLWLALMFSMWLIGAVSLVFGRVYCGYACPQMVFSELSHDVDRLADRVAARLLPRHRAGAARILAGTLLLAMAVAASVFFMGYFAPLPHVLLRLSQLEVGPWVGAVGATTALLGFLNFAFVRERFCRSVCPYGLLQGVIEDGRSLHVAFDREGECIECGACVRLCPMEIDIRRGAFQIECTRCGTCVDACDAVLGRLERPSLLGFRFDAASLRGWDAKRVLVTLATVGFGVALLVSVATRDMLAIRIAPLYDAVATADGELVEARFLLRAANRRGEAVSLDVVPEGLPRTVRLRGLEDPRVPPGEERRFEIVVTLPRSELGSSVTPFVWVVRSAEGLERFPAAFFAGGTV